MAYSLLLTVRATPADKDIPTLRSMLEISFPHKENIPYWDALCQGSLPRVIAQRLGALSLLPPLLARVGISAQGLILRRDEQRRPYLVTEDGALVDFDFNLSHTNAHVAAALLVGNGRVGIDIEEPIPPARALPLIKRYYTEGELSLLGESDDTLAAEFFTTAWVKREAMAKQEGRGMPLRYDTANPPSGITLWSGLLLNKGTRIAICAPQNDAPASPILVDSLPVQWT